jgi:hypothetical protein
MKVYNYYAIRGKQKSCLILLSYFECYNLIHLVGYHY